MMFQKDGESGHHGQFVRQPVTTVPNSALVNARADNVLVIRIRFGPVKNFHHAKLGQNGHRIQIVQ